MDPSQPGPRCWPALWESPTLAVVLPSPARPRLWGCIRAVDGGEVLATRLEHSSTGCRTASSVASGSRFQPLPSATSSYALVEAEKRVRCCGRTNGGTHLADGQRRPQRHRQPSVLLLRHPRRSGRCPTAIYNISLATSTSRIDGGRDVPASLVRLRRGLHPDHHELLDQPAKTPRPTSSTAMMEASRSVT